MQTGELHDQPAGRVGERRSRTADADGLALGEWGDHGDTIDEREAFRDSDQLFPELRRGVARHREFDGAPARLRAETETEIEIGVSVVPTGPEELLARQRRRNHLLGRRMFVTSGCTFLLERSLQPHHQVGGRLPEQTGRLGERAVAALALLEIRPQHHQRAHGDERHGGDVLGDEVQHSSHEDRHDQHRDRESLGRLLRRRLGCLQLDTGIERVEPRRPVEGNRAGDSSSGQADRADSLDQQRRVANDDLVVGTDHGTTDTDACDEHAVR